MQKKLNDRQMKFCKEFAASGNTYQAAIAAGYSENYSKGNAAKLLENERIKAVLNELYREHDNELIADGDELKKKLTEIIRMELQEKVVVTEFIKTGQSKARLIDKHPSIKNVLKAIELLGRMGGMFNDKLHLDGDVPVVISDDLEE